MPDFIIVGAGITGLTCAYELKKRGADVLVLEEAAQAGGKIGTERIQGYLLEAGPNSLRTENRETVELIEALGLTDRVIEASPNAKKRYILRDGKWVQVPSGPKQAITTRLFSLAGKLRVLAEPFTSSAKADDETVENFFVRHFGREVFDYAADPFVTGIYSGDPTKLSVRHAFKIFWQLDQQYGSLIRGMLMRPKKKDPNPVKKRIVSFPEGLGELIAELRDELQPQIAFHNAALRLTKDGEQYVLSSQEQRYTSRRVIFALPAYKAAPLISGLAASFAETLQSIDYPPVAVAYLGYRQDQFKVKPEGFGGLIPTNENRGILGVISSSSNFAGRAPAGHVLLTVIAGGAKHPEVQAWNNDRVMKNAQSEVHSLFEISGEPAFRHATLWKHAIPQYNVGYDAVLRSIDEAEKRLPGLHFIGNYRGGISMGSCIRSATELAARLV